MKDILYIILIQLAIFWAILTFSDVTGSGSIEIKAIQTPNIYALFAIAFIIITLRILKRKDIIR